MSYLTWFWLAIATVTLLGVLMLRRGLRGRRVDDHPICRRCGFDLFGRAEGSGVCSECGADLARPRAIVVGRRERRGGLVAGGALLLAIVLAVGGGVGYALATSADWRKYAPLAWLVRELEDPAPAARDAALKELDARVVAGKLPQQQIDRVTDKVLDIQGDKSKPWIPALGDFVENSRSAGKVSDDRWKRYAVQAPQLLLEIRPRVRRGDPMPVWIRHRDDRVGGRTRLGFQLRGSERTIGGKPLGKFNMGSGAQLRASGNGASGHTVEATEYEKLALPDGPHEISANLDMVLLDPWQSGAGRGANTNVLARLPLELKNSFVLLPPDQPSVTVRKDPSLRAAVEKAVPPPSDLMMSGWQSGRINMMLHVNSSPVPLGYEVIAVIGGTEQRISFIACEANLNHGWGASFQPTGLNGDTIDAIIYRPSVEAAARTTRVSEIWDGEIVFRNIKVAGMKK